jgi:hypothetical protein
MILHASAYRRPAISDAAAPDVAPWKFDRRARASRSIRPSARTRPHGVEVGAPRGTGDRLRALSLPEVLIVVGVVTILIAMLIPSLSSARAMIRRVMCASNLRHWGLALGYYRDDNDGFLPAEGHLGWLEGERRPGHEKPGTWYNTLPQYLGLPPYQELQGVNESIREMPALHVWICPSKNVSDLYKSRTGKNQFHYAMNEVLDGRGERDDEESETPGFPDQGEEPLPARLFEPYPHTVFMFDIFENSPSGFQRNVGTAFHRRRANVLFLSGAVETFGATDFVEGGDIEDGRLIWNHPSLYWGYTRPSSHDPSTLD